MGVDPAELGTGIDTSVPHSARIWNYWLGGKDNYPVDRAAGDAYAEVFPGITAVARGCRTFLANVITYLAADVGIDQFLDVGTGLPTTQNTHEIAQAANPRARIVYVDNDPLVLAHAHALLTSTPQGATDFIDADLHDPRAILAEAGELLDLRRPVALNFSSVLGHVAELDQARAIIAEMLAALPAGSYLAVNDGTHVIDGERFLRAQQGYDDTGAIPYVLRTPEQIATLFTGLELLEPGVVSCTRWRPPGVEIPDVPEVDQFGGVARKS